MNTESIPVAKFRLGSVVTTPNALRSLTQEDIVTGIVRHQSGDWGDIGKEDQQINNRALIEGRQVLSAYHALNGIKFWIITKADRSITTILLPKDY